MKETIILDGKIVSDSIKNNLKKEISLLSDRNIVPKLSAIIVGDDPASQIYVNTKYKTFKKFGCESEIHRFNYDISEKELIDFIYSLNHDNSIHGILVQLPLPSKINSDKILNSINPKKDVDGFHPHNLGLLLKGTPSFIPCTPLGCIEILKHYNIKTESKHVVIVGRSNIVGKPLMNLLSGKYSVGNATVTICHSHTKNLKNFTLIADILIAAVGKNNIITKDMVKEGAIVLDVGINRIPDQNKEKGYIISGDVDYSNLLSKVGAITPVPGGIGPMTIAMLLNNTVKSAKNINESN